MQNIINRQNISLADAVFEGGGIKGIAYAGAIQIFEDAGYKWNNLAGASAGAITAALLAVGYSAGSIKDIMENQLEFRKFKDSKGIGKIPVIGPIINLLFKKGLYKGDYFQNEMEDLLKKGLKDNLGKEVNGKVTFGDLIMQKLEGDLEEDYEKKYKYKLQVIISDISTNKMLILPKDSYEHFGIEPSDFEVSRAIRMSSSIPFFFEPMKQLDAKKKVHTIVDGGMLSNFPISIFDSNINNQAPQWPTFGFLLWEPGSERPYKRIKWLISVAKALIKTMMNAHDRKTVEEYINSRILKIPTGKYKTTDFNLSEDDISWLYNSGMQAAKKFLDNWDFSKHIEHRKLISVTKT